MGKFSDKNQKKMQKIITNKIIKKQKVTQKMKNSLK